MSSLYTPFHVRGVCDALLLAAMLIGPIFLLFGCLPPDSRLAGHRCRSCRPPAAVNWRPGRVAGRRGDCGNFEITQRPFIMQVSSYTMPPTRAMRCTRYGVYLLGPDCCSKSDVVPGPRLFIGGGGDCGSKTSRCRRRRPPRPGLPVHRKHHRRWSRGTYVARAVGCTPSTLRGSQSEEACQARGL